MQSPRSAFLPALVAFLSLFSIASTQQLKINYYSDHYCNNYKAELKVSWSDTMASTGSNCYNYNYGSSMLISDCYAGSWCVCLLYYKENCSGDYATIQYSGYDNHEQWEYNCLFNAPDVHSIRCYHYK
ncbi:hypothetical protein F4677DRAFT_463213, partial [Hypoxylon crocopeplum]